MKNKLSEKIMPVRILITGGTFDKEYDEITGKLYFKDTHMREILELGSIPTGCKDPDPDVD